MQQINIDSKDNLDPFSSTMLMFDLSRGRVLDDIKLSGEVKEMTSASIPNWYNTTLRYFLVLMRADPLEGPAVLNQCIYSLEMFAFTDEHPTLQRFSVLKLDSKFLEYR